VKIILNSLSDNDTGTLLQDMVKKNSVMKLLQEINS